MSSVGSTVVAGIARLAARRPRLVVTVWVVAIGLLAMAGRNLEQDLGTHAIFIKGSQTARAHEISVREFGTDYGIIVLLRGPEGEVEAQGRALATRLTSMPHSLVMSPWVGGSARVDGLGPRPGVGALLVRVLGSSDDQLSGLLPPVQRRIDATVHDPVRVSLAGPPVLVQSIRDASAKTSALGDMIAVPVLLFVLLFVFRSVLAAIIPLVVGGCVVGATRGIVAMLDGTVQFDFLVIGLIAMMGLALGVDYSLLVVSRFREERDGADSEQAVEATVRAAARSILPAGSALLLAMVLAQILLPSVLIQSVGVALIVATTLSMLSAICVVPALLMLLRNHLDRWSLPSRAAAGGMRLRWSRRVIARPGAVMAIVVGLLALAGLAFNLDSGVGSIAMLPSGDPGRQGQEDVEEALGPGWATPMEVVVDGHGSPITSAPRLNAIATFQRHLEDDPGVASITGLTRVVQASRKLNTIEGRLAAQERGLNRLQTGISRIGEGSEKTADGLARGASGSGELGAGIAATNAAAAGIAGGLERTSSGSSRLATGLGRASEGSGKLAQGTTKASGGVGRLAEGLSKAEEETGEIRGTARLFKNAMRSGNADLGELHGPLQSTEAQLSSALASLRRMSTGRADPEYAAALAAVEEAGRRLSGVDPDSGEPVDPPYAGVADGIERAEGEFGVGLYLAEKLDRNGKQATEGIGKLAQSSRKLDRGLRELAASSQQVSEGVGALSSNGQRLSPALRRLSDGAQRLVGGLGLLETGAGQLAGGLGQIASKSRALPRALRRIGSGLESRDGNGSTLEQVHRTSPGIFHSAYFVLASLDGSRSGQRAQLGSLINLNRGGSDARLLIIPRDHANTDAARETVERIEADGAELARKTGTEVVVGGVAPGNIDLNEVLRAQAPWMRIVLSLISLLVLIPVLRSLTIPILAALINLITVSASFGVMSLLFNDSLLGGPGYIDTSIVPAIIIVMFGLAIDYEVFIFARIREEYLRTGSTRAAVTGGLERTGPVVTGAAVIMILIFVAFSITALVSVRNFAVGQAIGIFIDAFIVRLIVVPALMLWLGERCWWCPRWLDRLLPGGASAEDGADALAHGRG